MPNTIEQGTAATIPSSSTNAPTEPRVWEIRQGGTVIAHSSDNQGWNVTRSTGDVLTVTAPLDADLSSETGGVYTENYEARHSGGETIVDNPEGGEEIP